MHLVQILLPMFTNDGDRIDPAKLAEVRRELTDRFGGVTAYQRAPATGLWRSPDGDVDRDDMIMVEVVVETLDRAWWAAYRRDLERRFDQEAIHARAVAVERI
jgi:hypothetical protein